MGEHDDCDGPCLVCGQLGEMRLSGDVLCGSCVQEMPDDDEDAHEWIVELLEAKGYEQITAWECARCGALLLRADVASHVCAAELLALSEGAEEEGP